MRRLRPRGWLPLIPSVGGGWLISPLVGEMPGRAEGGIRALFARRICGATPSVTW
ncbi:hypothetical protein SAMN03159496_01380 [Rhizobium sp. NFR07]|nr:hypothetical protein SAMN03159496_01380 [Rhizobium sp. NFR07]